MSIWLCQVPYQIPNSIPVMPQNVMDNPERVFTNVIFIVADEFKSLADLLVGFWAFFKPLSVSIRSSLTIRDMLSWVGFINHMGHELGGLAAYIHGAHLVLLDGVGLGTGGTLNVVDDVQRSCSEFLKEQLLDGAKHIVDEAAGTCLEGINGTLIVLGMQGWMVCKRD